MEQEEHVGGEGEDAIGLQNKQSNKTKHVNVVIIIIIINMKKLGWKKRKQEVTVKGKAKEKQEITKEREETGWQLLVHERKTLLEAMKKMGRGCKKKRKQERKGQTMQTDKQNKQQKRETIRAISSRTNWDEEATGWSETQDRDRRKSSWLDFTVLARLLFFVSFFIH